MSVGGAVRVPAPERDRHRPVSGGADSGQCPEVPGVRGFVRQHVLWFDETYDSGHDYQWDRVVEAAFQAETVLFVGTSFSVGVTELVMQAAARTGASVFSIDPEARTMPRVTAIRDAAEVVLPKVAQELSKAASGEVSGEAKCERS